MLICKFATSRSPASRIRSWLDYLEQMKNREPENGENITVLDSLIQQGRSWIREGDLEGVDAGFTQRTASG